jgi:uncharacterized protein YyaL (SSP411 family)
MPDSHWVKSQYTSWGTPGCKVSIIGLVPPCLPNATESSQVPASRFEARILVNTKNIVFMVTPICSNCSATSLIGSPGYGGTSNDGTKALLAEVPRHFLPNKILVLADDGEGQTFFSEKNEAIRAMSPVDGKPGACVCENFTCKAPVTDPKALKELLLTVK